VNASDAPPAAGLTCTPLTPDQIAQLVTAACSQRDLDTAADDPLLHYAVAEFDHCYDVAHRAAGHWSWASTLPTLTDAPGIGPGVAPAHQLIRLRIFGPDCEWVITSADGAAFTGARLTPDPAPQPAALQPRARHYLLADSPSARYRRSGGFTRITQRSGQTLVVPFDADPAATPLGHTREYFSAHPDTGAVTVTAVTSTGYSNRYPHTAGGADANADEARP
jgi:hypothetical protein